MTSSAPVPSEVRHWITDHWADVTTVTDVAGPRENSLVWRVNSSTDAAYVKISPDPQAFTREVHGYHHAATCLGVDEAPRLLAADPNLKAILTSPVPGVIVKDVALPAEQELRAHELAGYLLGRWHAHAPAHASGTARADAIAAVIDRVDAASACLQRTADRLTPPQRAVVTQACDELPHLAHDLPLVFRHGDFAPRNWLWNHERGTLALLDFEMADSGFAVEEFVWLFATTWPIRPHLKTACLTGFGRDFSDAEHRALTLLTALTALSYLDAGLNQQQPALITKAQGAFGNLLVVSG